MKSLRLIGTLVAKDLRIEYRSRHAFLTTLFFALLILVIFNFAFDPGDPAVAAATPGILWVSILFPGVIQLNRSFQSEREEGTLYGLILAPVDPGLIFLGKSLANWLMVTLVDLLILVAFVVFYNLEITGRLAWLLLLLVLAGWVFSSLGTLFAAMVSSVRTRDVLLPILLFPILVPVLIAAVNATRELLGRGELQFFYSWLGMLVATDVIFLAGAYVLFEYVLED